MGIIEIFICIFVGRVLAFDSVIKKQDAVFSQNFKGFFEKFVPFPFQRSFDLTPYDTIFSSWHSQTPDFHMLAEIPPVLNFPRVQVFCDESQLTVLVDQRSYGVVLTAEEVQLGVGCYSNGERPNQFVFIYSVNECGTTHTMQNGLKMFSNTLHLNLKKPLVWWQNPSIVHLSCIPKRTYDNTVFFTSMMPPEIGKSFNIKAMNPSWTSVAQSNVYERGQVVNLQVSAQTRPDEQLFIQSCFVSASPEPQTKPRDSLIMNKGCTAPSGSVQPVVQFVTTSRRDVVNFVLNTTYVISELYIHCSVVISEQGVTFGSKSCNYNVIQSRWEELHGDVGVCECCSFKCKSPSVRQLPEDAKATVSTGPFYIVDIDSKMSVTPAVSGPGEPSPAPPVTDSMQSDAVVTDETVSGTSVSRSKTASPPQGVVVVRHDPVARLTLWLPGQVQDTEQSPNVGSESDSLTLQLEESDLSNDLPVLQPSSTDQESGLDTPTNKINIPMSEEKTVSDQNQIDIHQMGDEPAQMQVDTDVMPQKETNDNQPIVRSKIQLSEGRDGSQTLSYEEEVTVQQERKAGLRSCGMDWLKRKQEPRLKGLHSIFLALLRRMDKAE